MVRLKSVWWPFGDEDTVLSFRAEHLKSVNHGSNAELSRDPDFDPFDFKTRVDNVSRDEAETISTYGEVTHRSDEHWRSELKGGWTVRHERSLADFDGSGEPRGDIRRHADLKCAGAQFKVFYDNGPRDLARPSAAPPPAQRRPRRG